MQPHVTDCCLSVCNVIIGEKIHWHKPWKNNLLYLVVFLFPRRSLQSGCTASRQCIYWHKSPLDSLLTASTWYEAFQHPWSRRRSGPALTKVHGNSFLLKALWIHTNSLSATQGAEWPLWLADGSLPMRALCRSLLVHLILYLKRELRENMEGIYLCKRWGKRQSERQAPRCHQCREMGVKRMKTYKWKSIRGGRKAYELGGR